MVFYPFNFIVPLIIITIITKREAYTFLGLWKLEYMRVGSARVCSVFSLWNE